MGKTLDELGKTITTVSEAWNRGKINNEGGIKDTFFSKKAPEKILTPELLKDFEAFKNIFNKSQLSAEALAEDFPNLNKKILDYAKTCKNGEMTTAGFEASLEKIPVSTKLGSMGLQALATAGNMLVSWAASAALQFVTEKITELANASEITAEKASGFADSVNASMQNMSSNASTLASLDEEYQSLAQGVNNLGENVSLSAEQYARYKEIIGQVSDIMPGMSTYFNSQGEAIGFMTGKLTSLTEQYEEYRKMQAKEFMTNGDEEGNTFQDALDHFNNNSKMGVFESLKNTVQNMFGSYDIDDLPVDTMIGTFEELQNKSKEEVIAFLNDVELDANGQYMQTSGNRAKAIAWP